MLQSLDLVFAPLDGMLNVDVTQLDGLVVDLSADLEDQADVLGSQPPLLKAYPVVPGRHYM